MAKRTRKTAGVAGGAQKESAPGIAAKPRRHWRLSPSSAARWLVCPYSAQVGLPEEPNKAAQAGTIAHEAACSYLTGRIDCLLELENTVYDSVSSLVGSRAANVARSVSSYVGYIGGKQGTKIFETAIQHNSIAEFGGTIDCSILHDSDLAVVDLKTGKWPVQPENNPQLASYLVLARQIVPEAKTFRAEIVQPTVWKKPKSATFTAGQLDIFEKQVMIASKSDKKQSGEHCRFCPLRPNCEEGKTYAIGKNW